MSTRYGLKVAISFSREFGFNDGCSRSDYRELSKKSRCAPKRPTCGLCVVVVVVCYMQYMRAATSPSPPPLLRGLLH